MGGLFRAFYIFSLPLYSSEYIKITSFNIAEFGEGDHNETRDLDFTAEILVATKLDLIKRHVLSH